MTDELIQRLSAASARSTIFDQNAQMTELVVTSQITRNPGSTLLQKVWEKPIVRAFACLHLTTMLFEGRVPNDEDYTNFAIGQGIRVGDELLELEGYASHFIELARNYSGNDIFTQVLLEQKVSQYCEEFLK